MEEAANRMEICRVSHRPEPLRSRSLLPPPSSVSCSCVSPFNLCCSRMCPPQRGRDAGELPPNVPVPLSVPGSALSRHVQLCGQRNRLCKLLSDCEYRRNRNEEKKTQMATCELTSISPQCLLAADRNTSRVSQEVVRDSPQRAAPD